MLYISLTSSLSFTLLFYFHFIQVLSGSSDPSAREGNIGFTLERFSESRLLYHFFTTGRVASKAEVSPCTDEEYVGAVLGFAQELARYAVGRGCEVGYCRLSYWCFKFTSVYNV